MDSRPDTNDVKCASFALHNALRLFAGSRHHREQTLGGIVHQRDLALLVGHDDGVGDRVNQQVQAIAFGAHLGLGRAQLGVVLVDLPSWPAEGR